MFEWVFAVTNTFSAAEQPLPKQMYPASHVHPAFVSHAFCLQQLRFRSRLNAQTRDGLLHDSLRRFANVSLESFGLQLTLQFQFLLRNGCPFHLHLPSFRCVSTPFPFASGFVAEALQDPVRLYHLRWYSHLHCRCNRRIPLPLSFHLSPLPSGSHLSIRISLARISQSPRNLHTPDICCH
jgi:hypothetical protein